MKRNIVVFLGILMVIVLRAPHVRPVLSDGTPLALGKRRNVIRQTQGEVMGRRIPAVLGVLTSSVLLALLPASANAATGMFEYTTPDGVQEILINPNDDTCYNADINGPTANKTNRDAIIFKGRNCTGTSITLQPKGAGNVEGASVKFVR
ncbi:hypothetical protein [Streptomyces sp. NPDC014734]|uniref:hypothetical protein n=1 Tax=Streptomyces sp. NPDC014734 TaxID=3364886 RepID=UPI0036FFF289